VAEANDLVGGDHDVSLLRKKLQASRGESHCTVASECDNVLLREINRRFVGNLFVQSAPQDTLVIDKLLALDCSVLVECNQEIPYVPDSFGVACSPLP
jgi:hypothetical protein